MDKIYSELSDALSALVHYPVDDWQYRAVSGGCIHDSGMVTLADGQQFFVKQNHVDQFTSFEHEMNGLEALNKSGQISVAKPLALGKNAQRAFLVLAIIDEGRPTQTFWSDFGQRFAALHLHTRGEQFGWHHDYPLGRIAERNTPHTDWVDFFRESRLVPQLALAKDHLGSKLMDKAEQILAKLETLIAPPPYPQLVHGDLWSGNFMVNVDGQPILIDPAVYYGHGEADLAMTQLFGGFSPTFYQAYHHVNPLPTDYNERAQIYNWYHLLNHLNLFGGSYLAAVRRTIERFS